MSETVVKIENLSKQYRLGSIGTQTLKGDLQRLWHKIRGKEDPLAKVATENNLDNVDGEYIWALRGINLEIKRGEVVGIIGKNGAGKSTLLKIISRITTPTEGVVKVKGRVASLLEVGTGFHPELTGRENIYLNGAILGMTKEEIRRKFDDIVDFAGIAKYIDTPVKRYSSGMYVRLGFAVAAHLDPDILIVDEVLAVGDAEFQKRAIGKMQDISKGEGRTVLFVSHNMASVQMLCSRGIWLNNGSIMSDGYVDSVINNYLNSFKKEVKYSGNNGSGEIRIKKINIFDDKNQNVDFLETGENYRFELEYELNSKEDFNKLDDLNFSIDFFNERNNYLFNVCNKLYFQNLSLKQLENYKKIVFEIRNLPLNAGKYFYKYTIYNNFDLIDEPAEKFEILVVSGFFINKKIDTRYGNNTVLVDFNFLLK